MRKPPGVRTPRTPSEELEWGLRRTQLALKHMEGVEGGATRPQCMTALWTCLNVLEDWLNPDQLLTEIERRILFETVMSAQAVARRLDALDGGTS